MIWCYLISVGLWLSQCFLGLAQQCSGGNCGDCISSNESCGWCAEEFFGAPRCDLVDSLRRRGCPRTSVQTSMDNVQTIVLNKVFNDEGDIVQLRPQRIQLTLSPFRKEVVRIQYKQVRLIRSGVRVISACNCISKLFFKWNKLK